MVTREDIESFLDRLSAEGASYSEVEPGLSIVGKLTREDGKSLQNAWVQVASEKGDDFPRRDGQRGAADDVGIAVETVQIAQLKDGAAFQDRPPVPARCAG